MAEKKEQKKPTPEEIAAAKEAKKAAGGKGGGGKKSAQADSPAAKEALKPSGPPRLKTLFDEQVRPKLASEKGLANPMAQPRLDKIVINVNMGRHLEGSKIPPHVKQTVLETITRITGQKPVVCKAKKSVSNFKLREGFESSAMVTLRRDRMWHFLDRLINLATPRIKDFRGLSRTAFDRQGNYAMGLQEQGVFPEINMAEVQFTHGMNINFTFRNSNPELSRFVLEQMGFPFAKPEEGGPGGRRKSA
ncbi:50S ribosomal protein L5 [Leptolyngbya sp. 15MV]|nr:50S ribosomal protein L5 [Leptolyngbya sp. 15MV]